MTNSLRLFIAVNLPANVKEQLHQLQQQFFATGGDVKWVEPNNFHITIKFLGETEQQQVMAVKDALAQSVTGMKPFELCLTKFGAFPERGTPRVVWAGLGGNINSLKRLQRQVEQKMATVGFSQEKRKFSPHLTLGRVKSNNPNNGFITAITSINDSINFEDKFAVNSIELMQSELTRKGPIYSPLVSYGLG